MKRRSRGLSRKRRGLVLLYSRTLDWPEGFGFGSVLHEVDGRGQVVTRIDPSDSERVTYWPPLAT